jgi:tetratricopeptide (TPR) repeat protein
MRLVLLAFVLCAVSPARANEDPDTEVARKHFEAGRVYYDANEYNKALDEFEKAKRVKPHPALDYNIGRCLDRLERYPEAIDAYQRYLASKPGDAAEITERVRMLKERLATQPPPVARPPEPPKTNSDGLLTETPPSLLEPPPAPPPAEKPKSRRTLAIVLGVIGGAVIVGGVIAVALLAKTTTAPATPDSLGGPWAATR